MKNINLSQLNTLVKFYSIPLFTVCFADDILKQNYEQLESMGLIYKVKETQNGTAFVAYQYSVTELGKEFINEILETSGSILDNMSKDSMELPMHEVVFTYDPSQPRKPLVIKSYGTNEELDCESDENPCVFEELLEEK